MTQTPSQPPEDLLARAKQAWRNAYAPYSGFRVGAAVRTPAGDIYAGANVENASYGLSRCAEQSAVQAMVSAGSRELAELLVFTDASEPAAPCGACRQILFEFGETATVHLVSRGDAASFTVSELLPQAFRLTRPEDGGS